MKTIAERVRDGATFLDMTVPGWVEKIDLGKLCLAAPCNCVLGQIFGDYGHGRIAVGLEYDEDKSDNVATLGFHALEDNNEYGPLTAAWRELILSRRAAAKASADEPRREVASL